MGTSSSDGEDEGLSHTLSTFRAIRVGADVMMLTGSGFSSRSDTVASVEMGLSSTKAATEQSLVELAKFEGKVDVLLR